MIPAITFRSKQIKLIVDSQWRSICFVALLRVTTINRRERIDGPAFQKKDELK